MEDGKIPLKISEAGHARRSFLLTVIILLATLILSSLCVIALLLTGPQGTSSAFQADLPTSLPTPDEKNASRLVSPAATATILESEPTASRPPNANVGRGRIIDYVGPTPVAGSIINHAEPTEGTSRIIIYAEPTKGTGRIIVYVDETLEAHRIIPYLEFLYTSEPAATKTPQFPRRIISYDDVE